MFGFTKSSLSTLRPAWITQALTLARIVSSAAKSMSAVSCPAALYDS